MLYQAVSEADAAAVAARVHQHLIDSDPEYAMSVAAGLTTAWDKPRQRSGTWSIQIHDRCLPALSAAEQARVTT